MAKWTEVNVLPASARDFERLLTDVAAPLVESLRGDFDRWHWFWEPEMRLRFRWRDGVSDGGARVSAWLDRVRDDGLLTSWSESAYDGEAAMYGPQIWDLVTADWMAGSELALAVIAGGKDLPERRSWYWARREHLFANELNVPEVAECLWEATGRLEEFWTSRSLLIADVRGAVGRFLEDERLLAGEALGLEIAIARKLRERDAPPAGRKRKSGRRRHR